MSNTNSSADQPTTEPSAYYCGVHGDLLAAPRSVRCAEAPAGHEYTLAPAPQPAVDTETEVQWGVRFDDGEEEGLASEQHANSTAAAHEGSARIRRTATTTYTPWEEA